MRLCGVFCPELEIGTSILSSEYFVEEERKRRIFVIEILIGSEGEKVTRYEIGNIDTTMTCKREQ